MAKSHSSHTPALSLDSFQLAGAFEIVDWLKNAIEVDGPSRPMYQTVASYILSDIEDAIADRVGIIEEDAQ